MKDFTKKVLENVIEELKKYQEVAGVYLFGSCVKNTTPPLSDVDIAVILKNPDPKKRQT